VANFRSAAAFDGVSQMLRDGEAVIESERHARSRWLLGGVRAVGIASVLLGHTANARTMLREAISLSRSPSLAYVRAMCEGYLALAHADDKDWAGATRWARAARSTVADSAIDHVLQAIPSHVASAVLARHSGAIGRAREELDAVARLFPLIANVPWFAADAAIRCGEVELLLQDPRRARALAETARGALATYRDPGALQGRLDRLSARIDEADHLGLTPAELRIVPYLTTHLSLPRIAARLGRSPATVKTQTLAIYSKLDVADRAGAVDRLVAAGLATSPVAGTRDGAFAG
jgi:LuxR family maltose regulon positive regulatory protein